MLDARRPLGRLFYRWDRHRQPPPSATSCTTPTARLREDSTCHCPKVISNNGQAVQLGLLNVFNPDANTLEGLFGNRSGAQKKDAAMSFVSAALQVSDAVTSRHIIDEEKFKLGLSNVIDGVVLCLNASTWSKPAPS
jgi:hypothetical protein